MVKGSEHFRVSLKAAKQLEKQVRGTAAGFNTPLFIVDTPACKCDVHSVEFYNGKYGVSSFVAPVVAPGRLFQYFDSLRSLPHAGRVAWRTHSRDEIVARVMSDVFDQERPSRDSRAVKPSERMRRPTRADLALSRRSSAGPAE